MTRVVAFIIRNWPLKLAAIGLATVLYAGLVLSQNARVWTGHITIEPINQPASAFILGSLPDVSNIRYFSPTESADRLSSAAFTATIDLANATPNPSCSCVTVPVNLVVADSSIRIIDFQPRAVIVRLDPIISRTVPVQVVEGQVPDGLQVSPPEIGQATVTASGPESVVSQIAAAQARVRIQPSGIDVDQLVDLVVVDGRGEQLQPVELDPASIRVRIQVGAQVTTKTVPVAPIVQGTPGNGYDLASTSIDPMVVTVAGRADLLAGITSLQTEPVSIDGATATLTTAVGLDLPDGVTMVGVATVKVTVTLRPQTATRDFSAAVVLVGAASDRTYALSADSVTVTLGGGTQALNAVDGTAFAASVDVSDLGAGPHDLVVRIAPPPNLKVITISPTRITVTVTLPATPPPTPSPTPTAPPTIEPTPSASPTPEIPPTPSASV